MACVTLIIRMPMISHTVRMTAGPPVLRAEPEPTKRPVPILPPGNKEWNSVGAQSEDRGERGEPTAIMFKWRRLTCCWSMLSCKAPLCDSGRFSPPWTTWALGSKRVGFNVNVATLVKWTDPYRVIPGAFLKLSGESPRRVSGVSLEVS